MPGQIVSLGVCDCQRCLAASKGNRQLAFIETGEVRLPKSGEWIRFDRGDERGDMAVFAVLGEEWFSSYPIIRVAEGSMSEEFQIKDSGKRQEFSSGMVRDITDDKTNYALVFDGPLFERLAAHLTKGAKKYEKRNWMKACTREELERAEESATRHFFQWKRGDKDEDHFAATVFNLNLAEYIKSRLNADPLA